MFEEDATDRKDTVDELRALIADVDPKFDEIAGLCERIPHFVVTIDKERLGELILALDDAKRCLESVKTRINAARTAADAHFGKIVFDGATCDEDLRVRIGRAMVSPDVRGFYSISDAEKFLAHVGDPLTFAKLASSKKELETYMDETLRLGRPTPPGVSKHMAPTTAVRRR